MHKLAGWYEMDHMIWSLSVGPYDVVNIIYSINNTVLYTLYKYTICLNII